MKMIDDVIIIGIDSGYGNIKTANCCFPASVSAYDKEPVFKENLLVNKEVIDSINTAHKLSTLEALLRKVISEELRNISLHIPFEPDTDSASDENESSIMDFLESF